MALYPSDGLDQVKHHITLTFHFRWIMKCYLELISSNVYMATVLRQELLCFSVCLAVYMLCYHRDNPNWLLVDLSLLGGTKLSKFINVTYIVSLAFEVVQCELK